MNYTQVSPSGTEVVMIEVNNAESSPVPGRPGATTRPAMQTPRLRTDQVSITESGPLPQVTDDKDRIYFVLDGEGTLKGKSGEAPLAKGAVVFRPGNKSSDHVQLDLSSGKLRFFQITLEVDNGKPLIREFGKWLDDALMVVQPDDPPAYEPANHYKTVNNCLFINDAVEVLRGQIGAGGGADRHCHEDFEQLTYVMAPWPDILSYNPHGVMHAGDDYEENLDLIVIYSPPYRESLKYC